jgi:hypothetical protein
MPQSDEPRALPPEGKGAPRHRAIPSRRIREASVRTERTRDGMPAAPDRLGDEQHHLDHRARLEERVHRGYHPRRGGRYDSEEDQSPSPEPLGPRVFSRAIQRALFPARFRAPTTITKYSGGDKAGVVARGLPAGMQVGRDGRRQPHHLQPPSLPLRRCPGMAGASASCVDLRLG